MPFNFKDKASNLSALNVGMLNKTASMFEYEGLPETIPYFELEKILQRGGYGFISKHGDNLYCFTGGLGGEPDVYGNPTNIIIANPALKYNATLDLLKDGVLIKSDDYMQGLMPIFNRYNAFIVENDINIMLYGYNTRTQKLISAPDDKTKESAEQYIKRSIDGDIAIVGENGMFDGVKLQSVQSGQTGGITSLIELQQYLKGSLFNEVGLSANFNMKRERLLSSEVEQGDGSLLTLVYNMLKCRVEAIEKINAMYGTDIKIKLGSVWDVKNAELSKDATPITNPNEAGEENANPEQGAGKDPKETIDIVGGEIDPESSEETKTLTVAEIEELLLDTTLSEDEVKYLNDEKAKQEVKE